ncbi:hypothetical protein J3R08_004403 [Micromonospora sp. HB375]|uniref:hypothetical protein n=1 Tax=unclassified Micromonospora TaxID=2617518 RepID=UPI001FD84721|nr:MULTISPECIES: hypothetical protein [unclassified Micromonospora]MBP1784553.1 hypothetical protein [Micromonospora sp. HB375]MDH6471655.1 hypothetical protein [Micromonospora sp. H404/HB375]
MPREPGRRHRRARTSTPARPATVAGRRRREVVTGRSPARPARPGGDPELDGADDPPEGPRRRRIMLVALAGAAVISATALVAALLTGAPERDAPAGTARPLTSAEADRVAALRVTNLRDVRAGVRVTVGAGGARTELVGWVDWARPLVYLDVGGPGADTDRGLAQATGSALLVRPDPGALPTPARPPLVPPADGWRMRSPAGGHGLGAVRDLLIGLGAARVDPPGANGRWLRHDSVGGIPVDVFQAPLAVPGDPLPTLWLDADARLHRLAGRLADGTPVTVELSRADRPTLHPVDALGGRPGQPRDLTDDEAERLAALPARLRAAGGAAVTVTAPLGPSATLRGSGTLSWATSSAYLVVIEDGSGRRTLRWARPGRVAEVQRSPDGPATPPTPVPAGLLAAPARPPGDDLDRLLDAALRAGTHAPEGAAVRVREDRLADRAVDVVEVPGGRRWWLDHGGLPRRLELRTGSGVWVRLDLTPGRVPGDSSAPTSR